MQARHQWAWLVWSAERCCLAFAQEWEVDQGIQTALQVYNGTRVWWERLLNFGPAVRLARELGPQHNVSWEEFLHYTCLVRGCCPLLHTNIVLNA